MSLALIGCVRQPRQFDAKNKLTPPGSGDVSVNINTATAAELERLPGIGTVLAERIIKYRNDHGGFRRAEHLMMVRGISDRKFRQIQQAVRVE